MLYKQLSDAGLTETEAKIYLAALELGEASVSRIATKSDIKRTTVYLSLENLMKKGLMSAIKKGGKIHYFSEDPRNLERVMDERKKHISDLMPQLLSFANFIDKKPTIRYFEETAGIKEVLKDALNYPKKEICVMYYDAYTSNFDEDFFSEYFIPERIKKRISVRKLLPQSEKLSPFDKTNSEFLQKSRCLSTDIFNIEIEIMIYGSDKVSILSFEEKFALIIESRKIHASLKSIFETMWSIGQEY
ncbi:MAG: helix-turn-helix domain-containing protein [Parcubacteria group bacterium]|jgi:sugar-specific transcriptional regulator TrmB